ncbi:uncharacterized protein ACHE_60799A [Aspergillus chevalieri]|uniref:Isochorismatase-like domain-containing protein n=1 Tax=Aspergillus chevalieri TaxID=182096 RepID=A0A7R7VU83_ASPCH|nr:uncharacterized protein ACHE_60799A [Aspergillus chevalieri]BCR90913.1 hypothetical protein ACHE_60799A [Aspergillus chevalieri]
MSCLIGAIENTPEGQALIANYIRWNDAVHRKTPRPLIVFTTLRFSHGQPEVERSKPFADLIAPFGTFEAGTPEAQIDGRFTLDEKDVLLHKTSPGLTLSGVVMSTIYRLFDLDYNIFVIADNVVALPVGQNAEFKKVMLDTLLPKMNLKAISLDEAIQALCQS